MTAQRDPAAARFAVLQALRLSGAGLVLFGVLLIAHRVEALAAVPEAVGYVVTAIGLLDFFVVPQLLAKRWRTPQ